MKMNRWIALFRGINVGGKNLLPMATLRRYLEAIQLTSIKTYIQSGNVVFDSKSKSSRSIQTAIIRKIDEEHSFCPQLLLLRQGEFQMAINMNPFSEAVSEPQTLHLFFLESPPEKPNVKALDLAKSPTESYELIDCVFYLHAPDGVGRSKLAATAEKHLGVTATARNFRTVEKLMALALET
jgi:uncharacterized protein (DUF1697 family)